MRMVLMVGVVDVVGKYDTYLLSILKIERI